LFRRRSYDVRNSVQMLFASFKGGSNVHDLSVEKSSVKGD